MPMFENLLIRLFVNLSPNSYVCNTIRMFILQFVCLSSNSYVCRSRRLNQPRPISEIFYSSVGSVEYLEFYVWEFQT